MKELKDRRLIKKNKKVKGHKGKKRKIKIR